MSVTEFKSTPVSYLGKKAKYVHLFDDFDLGRVEKFCDLTAGSGTIPLYMVEMRGARDLIVNDVSPFARMVQEVFFVRTPLAERRIALACRPKPVEGYLSSIIGEGNWKRCPPEIAAWVDGFCCANPDEPLLLLALACVLTEGASRFSMIVGKHLELLTPSILALQVEKRVRALKRRAHGALLHTRVTDCNYLDPPLEEWDMDGRVVYLDPAWPTQPGHKTADNSRTYGLYASVVMSVLAQEELPMPPEYEVSEEDFYEGMRKTIDGCLELGARMFVAYQTVESRLDAVTAEIFGGRKVNSTSADKNSASTLREYLFEVL